ncbi:MAG: hypothetical protein P4L53_11660 [Candidatus Obscuribacterales bacterium]|nr:hypothetical protein [Candidatus Obscuribacterales bacterium]
MARILILQEMEQNIDNLKEALEPHGHKLFIKQRELAALDTLKHEPIDLIIAAVYLRESDVFDFLKAVKAQDSTHEIPFVFYCSAISTFAKSVRGGLKIAAKAMGADLYVTMEEFDAVELCRQIEECLFNKTGEFMPKVATPIK